MGLTNFPPTSNYAKYAASSSLAATASYIATSSYIPTLQQVTTAGATTTNSVTVATMSVSNLSAASERIITTSGSALLNNYLQTDTEAVINTTVIAALLTGSNWLGSTYIGSTSGLVEGQKYIGPYYSYFYQNSTVVRYALDDVYPTVYSTTSTASVADRQIICTSGSAMTLYIPEATKMVYNNLSVKNINTGVVTVSASVSTIDGYNAQNIYQYENLQLMISGNNYYII